MSKILIDEAVVRQALEDFVDIKYGFEKSRIWGGMDWAYNPIHPVHYLPLRDKADVQISALHQAIADAALDKMAENARELGLSYEQPAPAQEPSSLAKAFNDGVFEGALREREHWLKPSPAPAQEPDPDELTIAYMSGLYEGKKRKPLTDEQIAEIAAQGHHRWIEFARAIEAAHGIKGNT